MDSVNFANGNKRFWESCLLLKLICENFGEFYISIFIFIFIFLFSGVIKVMKTLPGTRKIVRVVGEVSLESTVEEDLKKKHLEFNEVRVLFL